MLSGACGAFVTAQRSVVRIQDQDDVDVSALADGKTLQYDSVAGKYKHVTPASADFTGARIFNVKSYGAVLDGSTDDSTAVAAAYTAMLVSGHPRGVLLIPGPCKINTGLVFDLGFGLIDVWSSANFGSDDGSRFWLLCTGPIIPAAGIGTAVTVKNGFGAKIDIMINGGGNSTDVGLHLENLLHADWGIEAQNFAGIALHADATSSTRKRIRESQCRYVRVNSCGQAIFWKNIDAFGSFETVWDSNCVNGSYFGLCADIDIDYYTNFSPATQIYGVHFDGCNNCSIRQMELGDRATGALLRISSDSQGSDFGYIGGIRISSNGTPGAGVVLDEVKSITIDRLQTASLAKGLNIVGGGQNGIRVLHHTSLTGDTNPLYIEPHTNNAPIIDVGCHYRFNAGAAVVIASGITGGLLRLRGYFAAPNGTKALAIDSSSSGIELDVSELKEVSGYTSATNHAGSIRRLRKARLGGDVANADAVAAAEVGAEVTGNKGVANGYAGLGAGGLVPIAQLASGTPNGTKFVRDDGTLALPSAGSAILNELLPADIGYKAWSFDPAMATLAGGMVAGKLNACRVKLDAQQTITGAEIYVTSAGVTLTASQCWLAVVDASGNQQGLSADLSGVLNSTGQKTIPFAGGAVVLAAGVYYVLVLTNGSTQPQLARGGGNSIVNGRDSAPVRFAVGSGAGLTTIPSPVTMSTLSTLGVAYWAALY